MSQTHYSVGIWRKSSFSSGGNCVEVSSAEAVIAFRDTKEAHLAGGARPVLVVGRDAGIAFLTEVSTTNEFNGRW